MMTQYVTLGYCTIVFLTISLLLFSFPLQDDVMRFFICKNPLLRLEKRYNTPEYEHWKISHTCSINHYQSSCAMESAGAVAIFNSSLEKHNIRYSHYIGDGDTDSFGKVVASKPYGDELIPKNLECAGHVQKCLGTRLRKLRNNFKGQKLADGKGMSGKGRLTDKIINKMQNYYGMAIQQNKGALYAMKKSVMAILWHCSDIPDLNERHQFCPRSIHSWCKYQSDVITGMSTYKVYVNIPLAIRNELKR